MKLAEIDNKIANKLTKEIRYYNFDLVVPAFYTYIATDKRGDICVFTAEPIKNTEDNYWFNAFDECDIASTYIGNILEYIEISDGIIEDWEDSLKEI